MEKVRALGEPTEAEVREYRVKEFRPYGEAIAEKYLGRKIEESKLSVQLSEYAGEARTIVERAFVETLVGAITLDQAERSRQAIRGIQVVRTRPDISELWSRYDAIYSDYTALQQSAQEEIGAILNRELSTEGIGGSAVNPFIRSSALLKDRDKDVRSVLMERLRALQQTILDEA
jgi:hypothetical protein